MPYLRRISFWYLTLFLLFSVGRDLQLALTFSRSTDYFIFESNGASGWFPAALALTISLDLAASFYVLRPRPMGFWVILAALAFSSIYNILTTGLAIIDLEGVKAAYMVSREARGRPANPDTAAKVFSLAGMQATLAVASFLALSALGSLAINRCRFMASSNDA